MSKAIDEYRISLNDIYQQHKLELVAYVIKKFRFASSESEDIVHAAFEKIMQMDDEKLSEIKNLRAFLYKTTHNVAIDWRRHACVGQQFIEAAKVDTPTDSANYLDPSRALDGQQQLQLLGKALKRMPEKRRKLLVMNKFDGLSYAEIARRVNLSETVVRKHVGRALNDCLYALKLVRK